MSHPSSEVNRASLRTGLIVIGGDGNLACNVSGATVPLMRVASYTPAVDDVVSVLVVDGTAMILGKTTSVPVTAPPITETTVLPPAPPPPRPLPSTGTTTVTAMASGSYRPGYSLWESGDVKQGAYGAGVDYQGAWFYSGAALKAMAGRTCTRLRIRVGARLQIGSFNSAFTADFYRHSASTPGAHTVTAGPYGVSVPANSAARWIDLPTSFGQTLIDNGGGIAIRIGTYGGFAGRSKDPASGQLAISWSK